MFDILFARTFIIVWVMLLITAAGAFINKTFETKTELWVTVIASFVLLFGVLIFADSFPLNLAFVAAFSGVVGWQIWPTIEHYWESFKVNKYLKSKGIVLKKWETLTPEQLLDVSEYLKNNPSGNEWNKIVSQALFWTALAVVCTASIVFLTQYDFGFLWWILFIALLMLIIVGLLNIFFFKSPLLSLVKAYFWVVIFTLYLLYDFNRLEKAAGDETWWTAISIAVSIYLDIINLFLDLLQILWWGDN
jgi:FtsH-binding integral membrane protein